MDAGGSDTAAESVAWRWIDEIAAQLKPIYGKSALLIESPALPGEGRVIVLYLKTKPVAVATIFRDQMNFANLVRWRMPIASLPQVANSRCGSCDRTWLQFMATTTCRMGGCPWGGDV